MVRTCLLNWWSGLSSQRPHNNRPVYHFVLTWHGAALINDSRHIYLVISTVFVPKIKLHVINKKRKILTIMVSRLWAEISSIPLIILIHWGLSPGEGTKHHLIPNIKLVRLFKRKHTHTSSQYTSRPKDIQLAFTAMFAIFWNPAEQQAKPFLITCLFYLQ